MKHAADESMIHLVDQLLKETIQKNASDIHIEPSHEKIRIRLRIDGILHDFKSIEISLLLQLIARIKIMGNMDITQKRLPQDGRYQYLMSGQKIDMRISTFPTIFGEKCVIRILDQAHNHFNLESIGMNQSCLNQFKEIIQKPSGLLLVTGPTGSGKTTTLYGVLQMLNQESRNIVTLEDPVEYSLAGGITQAQMYPEIGFTFAHGMRCLLRQDPDIIMIGEIRDTTTARTAIEAAMTGHLVLSTLHTNDAASAIIRLIDMGIEPYLISASLSAVLAQRLVRTNCTKCSQDFEPNTTQKNKFKQFHIPIPTNITNGKGCFECHQSGYKGRTGIFELLIIRPTMRELINTNAQIETILNQAHIDGFTSLTKNALEKVALGLTTIDESMRVL